MAFEIEVVEDREVDGGEVLWAAHLPEPEHGTPGISPKPPSMSNEKLRTRISPAGVQPNDPR